MSSASTIPEIKKMTTDTAKDVSPLLALPVELRHTIYSYATTHEPWPALNPNDRPLSRLATLAPRQRAFLTTDRNDLNEPRLTCAHQLSQVSKAVRTDFYNWLQTASTMSVVTRVTGLDFQHVSHFLSSLGKQQKDAIRVRPDGTSDMRLTIELQGPYIKSSMENLHRWIEYVALFVEPERGAELSALYKTIDTDGPNRTAITWIALPQHQYHDTEIYKCLPMVAVKDAREYRDRMAPGVGRIEVNKIVATLAAYLVLYWL